MVELRLDGSLGMDAIHDAVTEALKLPAYYGRNLDALYDCLTEVAFDVEITLLHADRLGNRGPALERLLRDAAASNPHLHI